MVLQVQVTIFLKQLLNLYLLLLVNVVLELLQCGSQTSGECGAGGECEVLTADESGSQIDTECGVRYCCKHSACKWWHSNLDFLALVNLLLKLLGN